MMRVSFKSEGEGMGRLTLDEAFRDAESTV